MMPERCADCIGGHTCEALNGACLPPRELTPGELSSLERIATLRAQCGKYRRAIRRARNILLAHEHSSPRAGFPIEALTVLSDALEESQ